MSVLVADSVSKRYGGRAVLSSATLRLEAGAICAVIGRNGAGKSTLLQIAVGATSCDGGAVFLRGKHVARPTLPSFARQGVMHIATQGSLCPQMRLGDQLLLFRKVFGLGNIEKAVNELRLSPLLDRHVASLSGGERKRAELAAVLVRSPSCLVFDEVFRDVAPMDCELLMAALRRLADEGCAIAVSGHERSYVLTLADRVTWCTAGTTHGFGSPELALGNDLLRREYLGDARRPMFTPR